MTLKKKILFYKMMEKHQELTRTGKFRQANLLFELLRTGSVTLGLGDEPWEVESYLESIGLKPRYTRSYYRSVFTFRR